MQGICKWYNETKHFGFIKPDNSDKDIFVHQNGLIDRIKEGDRVTFETEEGQKGLNAVDVQLNND